MFLIIGARFFAWGSQRTPHQMRCGHCNTVTDFIEKKGMRFLTVFFIIPVLPLSGVKELLQCPNCGTKFNKEV